MQNIVKIKHKIKKYRPKKFSLKNKITFIQTFINYGNIFPKIDF